MAYICTCFLYQYYQEPKLYTRVLDGFNIGFTAVFFLECILKLVAFKPKVRTKVCSTMVLETFNCEDDYEI